MGVKDTWIRISRMFYRDTTVPLPNPEPELLEPPLFAMGDGKTLEDLLIPPPFCWKPDPINSLNLEMIFTLARAHDPIYPECTCEKKKVSVSVCIAYLTKFSLPQSVYLYSLKKRGDSAKQSKRG